MRSIENDTVVMEGVIENVIFHNADNGFTVFSMLVSEQVTLDGDDELICTGYLPAVNPGEELKVTGTFVHNPKYGRQLSVSQAEKTIPNTLAGMEKYLGSGVIKGIGERTAKKIVATFGERTFDIIEEDPTQLTRIKGINKEKAHRISEAFHEQASLRRAMLFLQDYGISPVYAMKIYKQYKEGTVEVVKSNPYKLADDIDGIGFKTADAIASRVGVAFDSPPRISAGIRYCLWEAASNGHVCLPERLLAGQAAELLSVNLELVMHQLTQMQMQRLIHRENPKQDEAGTGTLVFLSTFYYAEINVARKLLELASQNARSNRHDTAQSMQALERDSGLWLSDGQKEAVLSALTCGVLIITGGPGTGKTTTINTVIGLLSGQGYRIELTAPTGRAAKRMTEATGRDAKTIHRLLESSFIAEDARKQVFKKNEDDPIETDVLIVDETSMVDILLMQSLLKAVAPGTRLVLVGDVDQLPSVGPGNVLKDLIASGCLPVVRLTEVFRQAQESAIVMNAHRINRGEYPVFNEEKKDFFFLRRQNADEVALAVIDLVIRRLPGYLECDRMQDIQVLTPMRKSPLGAVGLNQLLQQHINPPKPDKREREYRSTVFREGDKVMQIKNNYSASWHVYDEYGHPTDEGEGVFNGDGGVIKEIDEVREQVTVLFDDNRQVEYDFSQLDELDLAYAITIHKSQGSEYRVVVIPIHSGPPMLMSRNLLYTAVTRAREMVVIVGVQAMMNQMVDNNREVSRYTALSRRMQPLPI